MPLNVTVKASGEELPQPEHGWQVAQLDSEVSPLSKSPAWRLWDCRFDLVSRHRTSKIYGKPNEAARQRSTVDPSIHFLACT